MPRRKWRMDVSTTQLPRAIDKASGLARPNMADYAQQRAAFSWERVRRDLFERADGAVNMAQVAIDRPATLTPTKLALRFVSRDNAVLDLSYEALLHQANRFANLLRSRGVARGQVVACLTG